MENYKIKVNNEAESREAQKLFFQLGYEWHGCGAAYNQIGGFKFITAYADEMRLAMGWGDDADKELTLPQLRDLVVLHRNDVNDANYKSHIDFYYVTDMHDYYFWNGHKWCESTQESIEGLTEIKSNSSEQGLISGADALKAMMEGKRVLYSGYKNQDWDTALSCNLGVFLKHEKFPDFSFKIVPRTIKLELEIPAPFEPKNKEKCFHLDYLEKCGFSSLLFDSSNNAHHKFIQYGAWRTEEEIKQVVAALRGIKG